MIIFESILKPKSPQDIDNAISEMDPNEILLRGITTTFSEHLETQPFSENFGKAKNRAMIKYAIKNGANPEINDGQLLSIAASAGWQRDSLYTLLSLYKFKQEYLDDALWQAVNKNNESGVNMLLHAGANPAADNMDVFFLGAEKQNSAALHALLVWAMKNKDKVNINKVRKGSTLLETVLKRGDFRRLILPIVDAGGKIGKRTEEAKKAAQIGNPKYLKYLKDYADRQFKGKPHQFTDLTVKNFPENSWSLTNTVERLIWSEKENDPHIWKYGKPNRKYTKKNKTNESIGNVLKPKSFDELKTDLDKMPPDRIIGHGKAKGLEDIVLYGIEKGGKITQELMRWTITRYKIKVLEEILKRDLSHINVENEALVAAMLGGFQPFEMIMDTLKLSPTDEMLRSAALNGNFKIIEKLLRYEMDPTIEKNIALSLAFHSKNDETIKIMLNDPRIRATLGDTKWKEYTKKYQGIKESLI